MNRIVFSEGLNGADKGCKDKKSMGTINGMKQKNGRIGRPFFNLVGRCKCCHFVPVGKRRVLSCAELDEKT